MILNDLINLLILRSQISKPNKLIVQVSARTWRIVTEIVKNGKVCLIKKLVNSKSQFRLIKNKQSKKKVVVIASSKKKITAKIGPPKLGKKIPKLQHLNDRHDHYLAIGPRGKESASVKKGKICSQNRQLTCKTDDIYTRESGEYIRKITQRSNTKVSNFSEFPHPMKEKQVKLNQIQAQDFSEFRSRTVKRNNKSMHKFGMKKMTQRNIDLK